MNSDHIIAHVLAEFRYHRRDRPRWADGSPGIGLPIPPSLLVRADTAIE
jgi:hypothetical protein